MFTEHLLCSGRGARHHCKQGNLASSPKSAGTPISTFILPHTLASRRWPQLDSILALPWFVSSPTTIPLLKQESEFPNQPQLPVLFLPLPPAHASSRLPTSPSQVIERLPTQTARLPLPVTPLGLPKLLLLFIYFCLSAALIFPIPNIRQSVPPPPLVPAEQAWTALTHYPASAEFLLITLNGSWVPFLCTSA